MTFIQAKTWEECRLQMQKIKDRCNEIIGKLSLPRKDARIQGLIHVRQMCNTLAHVPLALQHQAEENPNLIAKILLLEKTEDLEPLLKDFNKNSKATFITTIQFALENCIKAILEALGGPMPQSFYDSAKRIVEISKIPDPDQKRQLLMVPANIRNALHRNGIHTKASIPPINVDGAVYEFKQNQRLNCASWSHLFHIILKVLDIYEEILTSKTITSIKHIPSN